MTFRLGLTGSIGMGKSTTAKMFAARGCPVWDADSAVHKLYDVGGAAVKPIGILWPEAIIDGAVSRQALKDIILANSEALTRLERLVHPLVVQDRAHFASETQASIVAFDVPLLFEAGAESEMDAVACVFISADIQKRRVLARETMTEAQYLFILAKQMPIEEKLRRSDYQIETDTLEQAQIQVENVLKDITNRLNHA